MDNVEPSEKVDSRMVPPPTDDSDSIMELGTNNNSPSGSGLSSGSYVPPSPFTEDSQLFTPSTSDDYPPSDFPFWDSATASAIKSAKANQPSMFVSGWEETDDTQGVEVDPVFESSPAGQLLLAAEHGDLTRVSALLAELECSNPELVHSRDADGYTAFHRAAQENHVEVMKALLSRGADPQARTLDGWEPLHCATRWGCLETARFLIGQVLVDVNATTNGHITPLHLAACSKEPSGPLLAQLLLSHHRIDLSVRNGSGETAGQVARRTSKEMALLFEEAERKLGLSRTQECALRVGVGE